MAFFIGTDVDGHRILHLTSESSITSAKGHPTTSTSFHSRQKLIIFEKIEMSNPSVVVIKNENYNLFTNTEMQTYIDYVHSDPSKFGFVLDTTYNSIPFGMSSTGVYIKQSVSTSNTINFVIITDVVSIGELLNTDLTLDETGIYNNDVKLTDLKYITQTPINSVDPVINLAGLDYQFINWVDKANTLEIKANPVESYVAKGGHPVLGGSGIIPTLAQNITETIGFMTHSIYMAYAAGAFFNQCKFLAIKIEARNTLSCTGSPVNDPFSLFHLAFIACPQNQTGLNLRFVWPVGIDLVYDSNQSKYGIRISHLPVCGDPAYYSMEFRITISTFN